MSLLHVTSYQSCRYLDILPLEKEDKSMGTYKTISGVMCFSVII